MKIAVFGAGGVGGYFGARLAEAGEEVAFIARGAHLQAIREHGLVVESIAGDVTIAPATASDDPAEIGPVEVVLIATKTYQLDDVIAALPPLLGDDTLIVPLLNGVEAPARLAAVFGEKNVAGGLCGLFSFIAAPGRIRHVAATPFVTFGFQNRRDDRVDALRRSFERAVGVRVDTPADIDAAIWRKFLMVAAFGGVGALTRAPIGVIRTLPETRDLLERAMSEIAAVGRAHGVNLPADAVATGMRFLDAVEAHATTSLQRDLAAGRPSELDAWNGAAVRLGEQLGVPTPVNTVIYHSQLPLELRARGRLEFP